MKYQEINLNRIIIEPRFNLRATAGTYPPELRQSIDETGLITPLLILEEKGEHVLVHGRRRLTVLIDTGATKAPCGIIAEETPLEKILARLVAEQMVTETMSPYNIAMLLNLARPLGEDGRHALLRRVGINPRHQPVAAFTALTELAPEARQAVDDGTISPAIALSLFRLAPGARDPICRIITELKLSRQGQKELLEATIELARRRQQDDAEVATEIQGHCRSSEGNPPQKAAALKRFLTERLYPRSTAARREYNAFVAGLDLPKNATLTPAPAFESDRLTLTMNFQNRDELSRFWRNAKPATATRR